MTVDVFSFFDVVGKVRLHTGRGIADGIEKRVSVNMVDVVR